MRLASRLALIALIAPVAGCAGNANIYAPTPVPTPDFQAVGYAAWSNDEPPYRLFPGDELEVHVLSAPELDKTAVVGPDGRISLPLVQPVMVADRDLPTAEAMISMAYGSQLLHPRISVIVRPGPLKVFVGGEVEHPGVYDMPGDLNALQAIIMAGGYTRVAEKTGVVIVRRGLGGKQMLRTFDLAHAASDPRRLDLAPLRRFDIIIVPKTGVGETGDFVQQYIRDVIPVSLGFSNGGLAAGF